MARVATAETTWPDAVVTRGVHESAGHLQAGKAAVGVMSHDDTASAVSDRLTQLGGTTERHELTDEALQAAGDAVAV